MATLTRKLMKLLICDFDETITVKDTISPLARLAYLVKPQFRPAWKHFEETYMDGYNRLQPKFAAKRSLPLFRQRDPVITTDNYRDIFASEIEYQQQCREIELNSIREMEQKGLFKGVTTSSVKEYVSSRFGQMQNQIIRPGFKNCVTSALNNYGFELRVISINWSRELIEAAIPEGLIHGDDIRCNDLLVEGGVYTGEFSKCLLTGCDKEVVLSSMVSEVSAAGSEYWYIGDSETDLLAILHPDVNGVVLLDPRENESKFFKLTTSILGLDRHTMETFAHDDSTSYIQIATKQGNHGRTTCYIAKTWVAIELLLEQPSPI